MAKQLGNSELRRVFEHVFLPPKLPQDGDNQGECERDLIRVTLSTLETLLNTTEAVRNATTAIKHLKAVNSLPDAVVSESDLSQILNGLNDKMCAPVYIGSQNSAVIFSCQEDQLIAETFELSPLSSRVLEAKGRLTRSFPAAAISIDYSSHPRQALVPVIATTLSTLCAEPVLGMQPESSRAGEMHEEIRDTTSPAAVTELFVGFLKGFGSPVKVSAVFKNTRDEVLWSNAKLPWRRSPVWLLIKVVLQLVITRSPDGSTEVFKKVMILIMSQILDGATGSGFSPECLHAMSAKIVRRLHKLNAPTEPSDRIHDPVLKEVDAVLRNAAATISADWQTTQQSNSQRLDLDNLATLDLLQDTLVPLPALDEYISASQCRLKVSHGNFLVPPSSLIELSSSRLPPPLRFSHKPFHYATANLDQYEAWIAQHLEPWRKSQSERKSDACRELYELMKQYHGFAVTHYEGNPEGLSIMVLTIFELWVACDKLAIEECPMLAEYDPDISLDPLQNLLLPLPSQMDRLRKLELYFSTRATQSRDEFSAQMFDIASDNNFAARYFNGSEKHQRLKAAIEREADVARRDKTQEFHRMEVKYQEIQAEHEAADHADTYDDNGFHDKGPCPKCYQERRRKRLQIAIHEWPLPEDNATAKSVVFELDVPQWYVSWRDARVYLVCDLLNGKGESPPKGDKYPLIKDPHLKTLYVKSKQERRVGLVSWCKPTIATHFKPKPFRPSRVLENTLDLEDVCVVNGLNYRYFDENSEMYVGPFKIDDPLTESCTYKLSNSRLQRSINRPACRPDGEPPNAIMGSQDRCPGDMSLDEFKELSTVPYGHHIQWVNILQQLAMPGVDFKKGDTSLIFLQCSHQAGPAGTDWFRQAHAILRSNNRARDMLHQLDVAVDRVKQNWESAQALGLFTSLAIRVVHLNSSVRDLCLPLLAKIRQVTFGWLQSIRDAVHTTANPERREMFIAKSVEVALICASTYDVPKQHVDTTLTSVENVSMLVQSAIAIQQAGTDELWRSSTLQLIRLRFVRFLYRVADKISSQPEGIDDAIKQSWSSYKPGPIAWTKASVDTTDWITTVTGGDIPTRVHYGLLSGELLVNGVPLHQPPQEYRTQSLYKTFFGNAIVDVMPATSNGFRFSTKRRYGDHAVQIGLQRSLGTDELIVQGEHANGMIEYVPRRVLTRYLPSHFINDYVHWYNSTTGDVEFRPVEDPWNVSSPATWTLCRTARGNWQLTKDANAVVGLQTDTSKAVASILKSLATPHRTHCILQLNDNLLKIEIPALNLNFNLCQGGKSFRSKEFPSMVVDEDQGLGTLVGFSNKLMLKSESGKRLLLLPEASLTYRDQSQHVSVEVTAVDTISQVHAVYIDQRLGRLVGSGDVGCSLYLAYLHALTSFCLPDPLTLLTGTEQALAILDSCAVRSFSQLSQENINMLVLIAALSPGRFYYPSNKKVMQTVQWNNKLGFMAQHAGLRISVQAILNQARDAMILDPDLKLSFPSLPRCDEHLQQRDSIRSSSFRAPGYGAEDHSVQYDRSYVSRDRGHSCARANKASVMSGLMLRPSTDLHQSAIPIGDLWRALVDVSDLGGPETSLVTSQHHYDPVLTEKGNIRRVHARLPYHLRKLEKGLAPMERYSVAMWLSSMAFADDADMPLLQMFAMVSKSHDQLTTKAPEADMFALRHGLQRSEHDVTDIVKAHTRDLDDCPEAATEKLKNESQTYYDIRRKRLWNSAKSSAVDRVVAGLVKQWLTRSPAMPDVDGAADYIDMEAMMEKVMPKIQAWHDNNTLYDYLDSLTGSFDSCLIDPVTPPTMPVLPATRSISVLGHFTVQDLFSVPAPQICGAPSLSSRPSHSSDNDTMPSAKEPPHLCGLVKALEIAAGTSSYERSYVDDLRVSLEALQTHNDESLHDGGISLEDLILYLDACHDHVRACYDLLFDAVAQLPNSADERATQHFPRISTTFFLQQLAHDRVSQLPHDWKTAIVRYGVGLTALQRAERSVHLARSSQHIDLLKELGNPGHTNWNPDDHPQTLLMEIESGITIREVQEQVAAEMRHPSSGSNAVMQLNMGEGKSTVIIPMVAAALSNGSQLVRIVVAKPQSKQMAQMLIAKLGGLVKCRVFYLPFSRSLKLDDAAVKVMSRTLTDCMKSRGILLVQPEHILSFRLMAPECYMTGKESVGAALMRIQDTFDKHSRDIVDESDENYSVRFELIYTMGTPQTIEFSPERWLLMQQVLSVVKVVVADIAEELGSAVDMQSSSAGAFPRLRILHASATHTLVKAVAAYICDNGIDGFHMSRESQTIRDAIFDYITEVEPGKDAVALVEAGEFWTAYKAQILLLRGTLAGGILAFALGQKRWRVNYGLAARSPPTKLTVPYRAKDSPTARSEFSHPDVVIALTSLCYYYGGLTDEDMFTAFGHLVGSDQADAEYQLWVKDAPSLASSFHQLQGINLQDRLQCILQLFPHLCKGKAVVDYFLSHIVFPKETREFPHKLSVSGWDIGKEKKTVTTGFSGTNDSRHLLPLSVTQLDLPEQKHTNALVLEHLLQPTNGVELLASASPENQVSDAENLLSTILRLDPPVQVILDVGAQILEYDNLGLAKEWLRLSGPSKEAVIFVNNSDELCVLDRKGNPELLQTSPYASRLDACLVFLDESHTRGIDLQMPSDYRAAVTLGAHLTKDRLVQACMRMRKLGQGQSVIFCISQEIQAKISVNMQSYSGNSDITVADVLMWSISESHAETRRSMPLWAVQGERHVKHAQIWKKMQDQHGATCLSKAGAKKLLEEDAQSLEYRYRPSHSAGKSSVLTSSTDPNMKRIHARCLEFDGLPFSAGTLQEEQERELSPEIEQERQRPRAPPGKAARHALHEDIVEFAKSGRLNSLTEAYMPAFETLASTSAGSKIALHQLAGDRKLLASVDFATAVDPSGRSYNTDAFQRHVNWVLTRHAHGNNVIDCIMIISEFEANELLPQMTSTTITLHKYKARCNSGYKPLDNLDLFASFNTAALPKVPRSLSVQLGLFAGQLYISSYDDYLEICKFLGLCSQKLTQKSGRQTWKVASDGFIIRDGNGRIGGTSGLTKSPTKFFKVLMSKIRRNGDGISKTDMGLLLNGKLFQESYWET